MPLLSLALFNLLMSGHVLGQDNSSTRNEDGDGVRIQFGTIAPFQTLGWVFPEAQEGLLILDMDVNNTISSLTQLGQLLSSRAAQEQTGGPAQSLATRIHHLEQRLWDAVTSFQAAENRGSRRDRSVMAALLGGIGVAGVLNLITYGDLRRRQDSTEEELGHLVEVVGLHDHRISANTNNIVHIIDLINQGQELEWLKDIWWNLEGPVWDITHIADGLAQQRLHPAISRMIRMPEVWHNFQNKLLDKGLKVPGETWQVLTQLPISFWADGMRCQIAVHVPIIKAASNPAKLFQLLPHPVLHGSSMFRFKPHAQFLATSGLSMMELSDDQIEKCYRLHGIRYCTGARVEEKNNPRSCIKAIWSRNWRQSRRNCPLLAMPPTSQAWPLGTNRFNLLLPNETSLSIMCNGTLHSERRIKGQIQLTLPSRCFAVTPHLRMVPAQPLIRKEIVARRINMTTMVERESLSLTRPEQVRDSRQMEELRRDLRRRRNPWNISAIALSLVTITAGAGFIVFLYFRARKAWAHLHTLGPTNSSGTP